MGSPTPSRPPTLELTLLGGFTAEAGGAPITLPTRKAKALLAYLALAPQRAQEREKLSGLFWGETGKEQAQQSLRQTLFAIRRALPENVAPVLVTSPRMVTLDPKATSVDALELERRLRDPTRTNLETAAALYRGELLDGCTVEEPGFDEWLGTERSRLAELARSGLERLAQLQTEEGSLDGAVQTRLHLQRLDPWAEENHRALMRLYVRQGRRAAALAHYQACTAALEKELGVAPEPATRELYDEIVGGPAPALVSRPAVRPLARLIGRGPERDRLFEALASAWSGGGRVAVLIGEAGVGKTRLLEELAARCQELGGRIVRGRAFESEQVLPFAVWVDALRGDGSLLDAPTFDALPPAWQAELARLVPRGKSEPGFTPSPESVLRLFEAITGLLGRVAERCPLVLLLDDLHWADDLSLRLLAFVGRHLSRASRVLLAVTAREEELARAPFLPTLLRELSREQLSTTIEVRPLSEADTAALVRTLALPCDASEDPRVFSQIWAVSEGNPFVVLEVVRALAHGAPIDGVSRLTVPERVREVVAGHVARLPPFERDLAAIAAVIGREFEFAWLQTASARDSVDVASAVEQLARAGVLREQADKLYFTHDRIREVVYEGLLPQRRAVLHGCVARALEALHPDTGAVSNQLAFHYARANEPRAAVDYLTRFAESAARSFGLNEALVALAEASELTERLPEAERARWRIEIAVRRANSLAYLGRFAEIEPCLTRYESNLEQLNRLELTSQFHFWLGFNHSLVGHRALAAHHIELALDGAQRCGDAKTQRRAHGLLSYELAYASRYQEGIEHGLKAAADPESGEPEYVALGYMNLGLNYLPVGRHREALEAFERARAVARKAGIRRVEALVLAFSGYARTQLGELEAGLASCKQAAETAPDPVSTMATYSVLAHAHVECGQPDAALEILPNVTMMAETFGMRGSEALAHIASADAYLLKGDAETARGFAERGLSTSRAIGEPRNEGRSLTAAARCATALGQHDLAADQLATARRVFESIGADYDLGLCLCALGALAHARGDRGGAREHYAAAAKLFRSRGLDVAATRAAIFDAEITRR